MFNITKDLLRQKIKILTIGQLIRKLSKESLRLKN